MTRMKLGETQTLGTTSGWKCWVKPDGVHQANPVQHTPEGEQDSVRIQTVPTVCQEKNLEWTTHGVRTVNRHR